MKRNNPSEVPHQFKEFGAWIVEEDEKKEDK